MDEQPNLVSNMNKIADHICDIQMRVADISAVALEHNQIALNKLAREVNDLAACLRAFCEFQA